MTNIAVAKRPRKRPAKTAEAGRALARRKAKNLDPGVAAAQSGGVPTAVSADERWQMIATAAYYRAERRGFIGGTPDQDWLEAEAEVDRALSARDL